MAKILQKKNQTAAKQPEPKHYVLDTLIHQGQASRGTSFRVY
jgi:hypothetical protein